VLTARTSHVGLRPEVATASRVEELSPRRIRASARPPVRPLSCACTPGRSRQPSTRHWADLGEAGDSGDDVPMNVITDVIRTSNGAHPQTPTAALSIGLKPNGRDQARSPILLGRAVRHSHAEGAEWHRSEHSFRTLS
jgi:hypothetical protein